MMVRAPRRGLRMIGLGAADPSWFSDWTSSGHNEGGHILQFVETTIGNDFASASPVAVASGKSVPYSGGYNQSTAAPVLIVAQPDGSFQTLWLDRASNFGTPPQFAGSWFIHPGDDVMAAAIRRFVEPQLPAVASAPAFSEAVSVIGGQTAEQAAAIQAINTQNLQQAAAAGAVQQAAAGAASSGTALPPAASADETLPAGAPPLSSSTTAPAASGLSSVPTWAWALGGAALLWFMLRGGSHG